MNTIVTLSEIIAAHKKIAPLVLNTPTIEDESLNGLVMKLECFQPTGAFKVRGAANKLLSLTQEQLQRGVCTFSTGNHGLAVSYMAKKLGSHATVCMSDHVPTVKRDAIEKQGAAIILCGESQDRAGDRCAELVKNEGMTLIPPFDDPFIIAGQGTIGLELLFDYPDLDAIYVPLSGGGLISGIAAAAKAIKPEIKIIAFSPEKGAAMHASLAEGKPVEIPESPTYADSLLGGIGLDNRYTFAMTQKLVDEIILTPEAEIANGIRYLLENHRIIAEGAGAIGIGAVLSGRVRFTGKAAVIISGKNIGLDWIKKVLSEGEN